MLTVGFNGAQALLAGKVAAFTGFIPDDGVGLQVGGHPITSFWLDREGGPAYPGLVAFTTRHLIAADPALVRDFVAATVHGYEDTLHDPARSLQDLLRQNPSLQRPADGRLAAGLPAAVRRRRRRCRFGTLQSARIEELSRWMVGNGLIAAPVDFARYGSDGFLPTHP